MLYALPAYSTEALLVDTTCCELSSIVLCMFVLECCVFCFPRSSTRVDVNFSYAATARQFFRNLLAVPSIRVALFFVRDALSSKIAYFFSP